MTSMVLDPLDIFSHIQGMSLMPTSRNPALAQGATTLLTVSLASSPNQRSSVGFLPPGPALFQMAPSEVTHDIPNAALMSVFQFSSFFTFHQRTSPSILRLSSLAFQCNPYLIGS